MKVKYYIKKPTMIKAVQWTGTYKSYLEIQKIFPKLRTMTLTMDADKNIFEWKIDTLKGSYKVSPHDYIIEGIKGEYYPCKPDIFKATYQEVEGV